jgi:hypothetical protein
MKNILYIFLVVTLMTACTKTDVKVVSTLQMPVVESYLIAGGPILVKLSLPVAVNEDATNPQFINGQTVVVTINNVPTTLKSIGNGLYQDTTKIVKEGYTYNLSFNYNGLNVNASTTVPSKPVGFVASASTISIPQFGGGFKYGSGASPTFPSPIVYTWTNNDQSYYFLAAKCIETSLTSINTDTTENRPRFSRPPTQENTASLSFNSFSYYGQHHVYLYKANIEYAALYKSTGTSSLNITNPVTNVQNGFGIFTSFGVDSLNLTVTK